MRHCVWGSSRVRRTSRSCGNKGCRLFRSYITRMIMLYGRRGLTEIALQLFIEMKSDCNPSRNTYKYMIISLCGRKGRRVDEAVSIFQEMVRSGKVKEALAKMESMKQASVKPTMHVYTSLIVHFCKEKHIKRALEVLNQMQEGGCAYTRVLEHGDGC